MLCIPETSAAVSQEIFSTLLNEFLHSHSFPRAVTALAHEVVKTSIELYRHCREILLPPPSKSHYVFNLRDLSKCMQGMMMARPQPGYWTQARFLQLWVHETSRVFHDRLVDAEDRKMFAQ